MKIFNLLLIVSFLFNLNAFSQENTLLIDNVSSYDFNGIKPIDNKMFYALTRVEGSATARELLLISPDLKLIGRHKIELGRLVQVRAVASNENTVLIYISSDKTGHLYSYNLAGEEIQHKEIDAPSEWLNTASLFPAGEDGYFLIRQVKPKKVGFSIDLLSSSLETTWSKEYVPEKQKSIPVASAALKDQVTVIYTNQKAAYAVCLGLDGEEKYKTEIKHTDPDMMLKVSHAEYTPSGSLSVFGEFEEKSMMKYTGQRFRYFLTAISATGESDFFKSIVWEDKQIKQLTSLSMLPCYNKGENPELFIHEFNPSTTGYQIIGETYRFVSASDKDYPSVGGGKKVEGSDTPSIYSKSAFFFAMDLVVIDYDIKGELVGIKKIGRPVKRTTSKGTINGQNPENVAKKLADFGRFNYRFTHELEDKTAIKVSLGQHFNELYVGFIRQEDSFDNLFSRDYLELPIQKASKGKRELTNALYKEEDLGYKTLATNNWMIQTDILASTQPGKYILMEYKGKSIKLTLKDIEPTTDPTLIKGVSNPSNIHYSGVLSDKLSVTYFSESADLGENWGFLLLDQNMLIKKKQVIIIPKDANNMKTLSNGKTILMTWTMNDKKDYVLLMDENGEIVKQESLPETPNPDKQKSATVWKTAGESGYYAIRKREKGNMFGYEVTFFDNQFKEIWSNQYMDSATLNTALEVFATNSDGVIIRERKKFEDQPSIPHFSYHADHLIHVNGEGKKTQNGNLISEGESKRTVLCGSNSSNAFFGAGILMKNINEIDRESQGLWIEALNGDQKTELLSWNKIGTAFEMPDFEKNIKTGVLGFKLHALTGVEDELLLLTQLKINGSETDSTLKKGTLSDFIVFRFNASGIYQGFYPIIIPPMDVTAASSSRTTFGFQYLNNNGKNIVYTLLGEDLEPYAVSTPIADVNPRKWTIAPGRMMDDTKPAEAGAIRQKTAFESKLADFSEKVDEIDKKVSNFSIWGNSSSGSPSAPKYKHKTNTGYINGGLNRVFLYHYNNENRRLQLSAIEME